MGRIVEKKQKVVKIYDVFQLIEDFSLIKGYRVGHMHIGSFNSILQIESIVSENMLDDMKLVLDKIKGSNVTNMMVIDKNTNRIIELFGITERELGEK